MLPSEKEKEIVLSEKDLDQIIEELEDMQVAMKRLLLKVSGIMRRSGYQAQITHHAED